MHHAMIRTESMIYLIGLQEEKSLATMIYFHMSFVETAKSDKIYLKVDIDPETIRENVKQAATIKEIKEAVDELLSIGYVKEIEKDFYSIGERFIEENFYYYEALHNPLIAEMF